MNIQQRNEPFAENLKGMLTAARRKMIQEHCGYTTQQLTDMLAGRKLITIRDAIEMTKAIGISIEDVLQKKEPGILNNQFTCIVVETDEKNPVSIAEITNREVKAADGYRVRMNLREA